MAEAEGNFGLGVAKKKTETGTGEAFHCWDCLAAKLNRSTSPSLPSSQQIVEKAVFYDCPHSFRATFT